MPAMHGLGHEILGATRCISMHVLGPTRGPGPASSMVAQLLQTGDRSSAVEAEVDWQSWERNDVKEPLQQLGGS